MRDKWLWPMRVYFVVTMVLVVAYGIGRAFTPFWLDIAFIAWCAGFVVAWSIYVRRKRDGNRSAPRAPR
jgi:uncharacterized membrane protein YhaH (DUF805 family)